MMENKPVGFGGRFELLGTKVAPVVKKEIGRRTAV